MSVQVKRDGVRDHQRCVVVRRGNVACELNHAARVQPLLQPFPRSDRAKAQRIILDAHGEARIVAEEMRAVCRRATGERDGIGEGRLGLGRHADGRARRKVAHADFLAAGQIDVVRRANGVGVAGNGRNARNVEMAAVHVHTAAFTGLVAGDDAVGHRERAVVVHVHATAADSRVAGDFTA